MHDSCGNDNASEYYLNCAYEVWARENVHGYKKTRKRSCPAVARRVRGNPFYRKRLHLWLSSQLCFWCRRALRFEETTVDHLRPRSKGGSNRMSNLVLSCSPCNQERADDVYDAEDTDV